MDLDELEGDTDNSKESQIEQAIEETEAEFEVNEINMNKEINHLQDELTSVSFSVKTHSEIFIDIFIISPIF